MAHGRKRRIKGTGSLQREKNGVWTIRAMVNGQRISKSTGKTDYDEAVEFLNTFMAPFLKKQRVLAIKMLEAKIADVEQREKIEEEHRPQMPLNNSWWYYADSCRRKDVADATLKTKKGVWDNFVAWMALVYEDNMEVRAVTPEMAETYLRFMKKTVASTTWNGRLCTLREVYRILMPKAKAKANPFDGIPLLPEDCHSRRGLSNDEIRRLLKSAEAFGWEWRVLFLIAIYTGLRLGDCCMLTWDKVNLAQEVIQLVPAKTRRTAQGRVATIPIHPHLMRIFRAMDERNRAHPELNYHPLWGKSRPNYVLQLVSRRYELARHRVSHVLGKIFRGAGIRMSVEIEGRKWKTPEATFHSLRHTFVSLAANAGIPLHIIQSIVGHESTAMTWHYYHEDEEKLRKAVGAIPSFEEGRDVASEISDPEDGEDETEEGTEPEEGNEPEDKEDGNEG